MNRFKRLLLLGLLVSSCAWAQQFSSITIGTTAPNQLGDGPGPVFAVDGQQYTSTQVFTWPAGSEHIVQFILSLDPVTQLPLAYQGTTGDNTRFYFGSWVDNAGLLGPGSNPVQTVTASPTLTSLIASVTVEYRVHVNFQTGNGTDTVVCPTGAGAPGVPGTLPGIIYLNNQCIAGITDFWIGAGPVVLNAFPYPGFVFLGWSINGGPNTYLLTYNLSGPIQITPLWEPAKLVHFMTNPSGLTVLVDHSPVSTAGNPLTPVSPLDYGSSCTAGWATLPPAAPAGFVQLCVGDFDFAPGSTHVVGAVSPQQDAQGNYWIFTSYANGLTQNSSYVVDTNTSTAATMQANFISGMEVSILTNPGGLKVTVDGNPSGIPPYNFVWGAGQTHTVAAPALQTDSNGRQWAFSSWSNKGPATQTITVPAGGGYVVTANFVELGQLNVTSNPAGLTFTVGGSPCTTPCTVNGPSGTQTQVSAPASIPTSPTSRYDFSGWGDGTTNASATVTFNQNVQSVAASYHASYMLAMSANPTGGASFALAPTTPDGYYTDGTAVSITATPKPGFQFRRWDGDLSGTFNTGYLTMSSPHSAIADLNSVPYIPPAGIQTAAGPTPDGSVGVGSLISIYGTNLAPSLVIGPSNPLSQTIGGVTVQIASSTLPLSFVSAGQINAQVPTALPDGNYPLVVHSAGQADVTGSVTISRDAPALFQTPTPQNVPLAVAVHQDGTPVTLSSPARHGEQVTLYGTGFGPYTLGLPDGFATPATATYAVADPVTITVGGVQKQPDFAGAATGLVGIVLVQFTITSDIPSNAPLDLTVSVNGKISSKVTLPVQ